jgi:hypothetical protein
VVVFARKPSVVMPVFDEHVTFFAKFLYNRWVSDIMTSARLLRRGIRIYEVPVDYRARTREEGKKLTVVNGLRVVVTLMRCRFT